jgi:hypothetical protein
VYFSAVDFNRRSIRNRKSLIATTLEQPKTQPYAVRGDSLSCFTASIGLYMATQGIDYEMAIGSQLFLASRVQPSAVLPVVFTHYHTPFLGERPAHSLALERHSHIGSLEAVEAIVAECKRSGAAIVVGDAARLPWLVTFGEKHVPHWFVVDAVSEEGDSLHVTDTFEFLDEQGEQRPFSGWFDWEAFSKIVGVVADWPEVYRHRERWAFGCEEQLSHISESPSFVCNWFEATRPSRKNTLTAGESLELIRESIAYHSGAKRPDFLPVEWHCGLDAIRVLPDVFADRLADPGLYAISDDIWVIARTRQLFARTLMDVADKIGSGSLRTLAETAGEHLTSQWLALPRIMRFNVGCMERGRAPRPLLIDLMRQVVDLEEQYVKQLGDIVSSLEAA